MVTANGVRLCVDECGPPTGPGILLLGGAASSMDWWEEEFCRRLAGHDRRVVRYDYRDTGQSVASPAGRPDYSGQDLLDDAVALIDVLGLAPVHLVGLSMGGGLAQILAARHPERVATLTLMSTTPVSGAEALPPPDERFTSAATPPAPDWGNRAATVDYLLAGLASFAGDLGVDEPRARQVIARMVDRTADVAASQTNHWMLDSADAEDLPGITVPTLVVHGTADPLLPVAHGEALARRIPGATFLPLPGVGHEYPPEPTWDTVIGALREHTAR
jgi:pimeloyl-ACP methyl ester carboxylesterase